MSKVILSILVIFSIPLLAIASQGLSVGYVAQNAMEPISLASTIINNASFVIGGAFLFLRH